VNGRAHSPLLLPILGGESFETLARPSEELGPADEVLGRPKGTPSAALLLGNVRPSGEHPAQHVGEDGGDL